jgi:hypothetical protein
VQAVGDEPGGRDGSGRAMLVVLVVDHGHAVIDVGGEGAAPEGRCV